MFLGRTNEAKAIHSQWFGKKPFGDTLWQDWVAANFAELRSLGLSSPEMDDILASFAKTK
jgi:1,2-phenylacetyl-CoA epoxidase catalytic subunit